MGGIHDPGGSQRRQERGCCRARVAGGLTHLGAQMLAGQTQACGQVQRACAHPESCCPNMDQIQVLLLWAGWKEESGGPSTHVRLNASTRQATHGIFNIPQKKSSGGGGQCEGRWGVLTLRAEKQCQKGGAVKVTHTGAPKHLRNQNILE